MCVCLVIRSRTGKLRKKEEKKRAAGKKGSIYEEEYLLNQLAKMTTETLPSLQSTFNTVFCTRSCRIRHRTINPPYFDSLYMIYANTGQVKSVVPTLFLLTTNLRCIDPSQSTVTSSRENLVQMAERLQTRLADFQSDLTAQIQKVWSVRETPTPITLTNEAADHHTSQKEAPAECAPTHNVTVIARPVIADVHSWKLSTFG